MGTWGCESLLGRCSQTPPFYIFQSATPGCLSKKRPQRSGLRVQGEIEYDLLGHLARLLKLETQAWERASPPDNHSHLFPLRASHWQPSAHWILHPSAAQEDSWFLFPSSRVSPCQKNLNHPEERKPSCCRIKCHSKRHM